MHAGENERLASVAEKEMCRRFEVARTPALGLGLALTATPTLTASPSLPMTSL